jgi:tRNA-dihydrouridine synthase
VPELLQIGSVRITPATILAPMAGVTDTVFRRFIRNASFVRSAYDVMAPPRWTLVCHSHANIAGCR